MCAHAASAGIATPSNCSSLDSGHVQLEQCHGGPAWSPRSVPSVFAPEHQAFDTYRGVVIESMTLVDIDVVRSESLKRPLDGCEDPLRIRREMMDSNQPRHTFRLRRALLAKPAGPYDSASPHSKNVLVMMTTDSRGIL